MRKGPQPDPRCPPAVCERQGASSGRV